MQKHCPDNWRLSTKIHDVGTKKPVWKSKLQIIFSPFCQIFATLFLNHSILFIYLFIKRYILQIFLCLYYQALKKHY
jgi:hypothetical protein